MLFRKRPRDPARQKIERFEAWFQVAPTSPFPKLGGRIEWDAFASGDSEIEFSAVIPGLPDGSEVSLMWGDVEVMSLVAKGGVVSQDLETKDGDDVPRLAHEQVELVYEGTVIARAHLEPD